MTQPLDETQKCADEVLRIAASRTPDLRPIGTDAVFDKIRSQCETFHGPHGQAAFLARLVAWSSTRRNTTNGTAQSKRQFAKRVKEDVTGITFPNPDDYLYAGKGWKIVMKTKLFKRMYGIDDPLAMEIMDALTNKDMAPYSATERELASLLSREFTDAQESMKNAAMYVVAAIVHTAFAGNQPVTSRR